MKLGSIIFDEKEQPGRSSDSGAVATGTGTLSPRPSAGLHSSLLALMTCVIPSLKRYASELLFALCTDKGENGAPPPRLNTYTARSENRC